MDSAKAIAWEATIVHIIFPGGFSNKLRVTFGELPAGDKRKSMLAGGVQWEGMGDKEGVKRLCLVRGLRNDSGLNNCFLNVVIQCLWHLHSFREALLSLQPQVGLLPL